MSHSDGIVAQIDYTGMTVDEAVAALLAALPDPDTTSTSGSQQGSTYLGFLDEMSPMALTQLRIELQAMADSAAGGGADDVAFGSYTMVAADDTANLTDIVTGLANITIAECAVTVWRAGVNVTADAVISEPAAGTIRVANGAATYVVTAGDIVNWFARSA